MACCRVLLQVVPWAWPGAMFCSGQSGPASCTRVWQLLLPAQCLREQEDLGGGWENVSKTLHPSYMHVDRGSPVFLSLRVLLMPPQSLPHAEVGAWLAGGQGSQGEKDGAVRREESGSFAMGRMGPQLGWLWGGMEEPCHTAVAGVGL